MIGNSDEILQPELRVKFVLISFDLAQKSTFRYGSENGDVFKKRQKGCSFFTNFPPAFKTFVRFQEAECLHNRWGMVNGAYIVIFGIYTIRAPRGV